MTRTGPARATRPRADQGFALVIVIWGIGIIGLLTLSYIMTARLRAQAAINLSSGAQAEELANGASNIAILSTNSSANNGEQAAPRFSPDGRPVFCAMPQGAVAEIDVEDEAGKIDINAAPKKLLRDLLVGVGTNSHRSEQIAAAIIRFRTAPSSDLDSGPRAYRQAGRDFGPKRALFQSTLELDQVMGISPRLFKLLLPLVTVYSHRPQINPLLAPPALIAALTRASSSKVLALIKTPYPNSVDRADPLLSTGVAAVFKSVFLTVHAEVMTPTGGFFVRVALVQSQTGSQGTEPAIKEWRGGAHHYSTTLREILTRGAEASLALNPC